MDAESGRAALVEILGDLYNEEYEDLVEYMVCSFVARHDPNRKMARPSPMRALMCVRRARD